MTFQLPFKSSDKFVPLFKEFDERLKALRINTYGVSVTTMEEVFLNSAKVVDREYAQNLKEKRGQNDQGVSCAEGAKHLIGDDTTDRENRKDFTRTSSDIQENLFFRHFSANFIKRMNYALRDKKMFIMELLIPVVYTAVVFTMVKVVFSMTYVPSYPMDTRYYNKEGQGDMTKKSRIIWSDYGRNKTMEEMMGFVPDDRMIPQYADVEPLWTPDVCDTLGKYLWCHDPVTSRYGITRSITVPAPISSRSWPSRASFWTIV